MRVQQGGFYKEGPAGVRRESPVRVAQPPAMKNHFSITAANERAFVLSLKPTCWLTVMGLPGHPLTRHGLKSPCLFLCSSVRVSHLLLSRFPLSKLIPIA